MTYPTVVSSVGEVEPADEDRCPANSWRRPALASLACVVAPAGAIAVGVAIHALALAADPQACHGFGCTPAGLGAVMVAYLFAPYALVAAWSLTWIGWAMTRREDDHTNKVACWWPMWALATVTLAMMLASS